jgi:predicted phage-related endonuclease
MTAIERIPITDRVTWLALRAHDITASDVPAVCGEGVYGSAAQVWAHKRGLIPAQEMTEPMKRGLWGEPAVFEALSWERPEWEIKRAKVYLRDSAARLGATPDGVAIVPGKPGITVVQCKIVSAQSFRDKWLENPDDNPHDPFAAAQPPLGYQLQTLTESMLADSEQGVIPALIVDSWKWSLRIFDVRRHAAAEAMIRDRVAKFWRNYLDAGVQPPVDPARDEALVKALHPQDDGSEIDLGADNELPSLADALMAARTDKKNAESREKTAKTAIADKIGSAAFARIADGRRISHKSTHRAGYEVKPTEFRIMKILTA